MPPKEPDLFSAYQDDPVFKGIVSDDKSKWLKALDEFKHKHADDDRALTYAVMMDHLAQEEDLEERNAECFASDDSRLKGN